MYSRFLSTLTRSPATKPSLIPGETQKGRRAYLLVRAIWTSHKAYVLHFSDCGIGMEGRKSFSGMEGLVGKAEGRKEEESPVNLEELSLKV